MWCANRCGLCCELPQYKCGDSAPTTNPGLCVELADPVKTPIQTRDARCKEAAASRHCLASCGMCDTSEFVCRDKHPACHFLRPLCGEEKHILRMNRLCPKSCDETIENNKACEQMKKLHDFRKSTVPRVQKCRDIGGGCKQNILLCENEFYEESLAKNCAKTCGHCVEENFQVGNR